MLVFYAFIWVIFVCWAGGACGGLVYALSRAIVNMLHISIVYIEETKFVWLDQIILAPPQKGNAAHKSKQCLLII